MIRNKQNVCIYKNYFLPSVRFLLTVHDLTQTHVKQLDAFTHVFLKRWAGLPPSATNLVLHMKVGLDIPTIETLYNTCHSINHTAMRMKGDITVNSALDNAIQRESEWTRKKSTVVYSETVLTHAMSLNCVNGEIPTFPEEIREKEITKLTHKLKASVKTKVYSEVLEEQRRHLDTLMKQGDYLKFADQEKCDPNWNSIVYNLPKRTMKFLPPLLK